MSKGGAIERTLRNGRTHLLDELLAGVAVSHRDPAAVIGEMDHANRAAAPRHLGLRIRAHNVAAVAVPHNARRERCGLVDRAAVGCNHRVPLLHEWVELRRVRLRWGKREREEEEESERGWD